MKGKRLDERLVELGLADSRTRAKALIMTGNVLVDDVPFEKAGTVVKDAAKIRIKGGQKTYVSRGGDKLAGALDDLQVDPVEALQRTRVANAARRRDEWIDH